MDNYCDPPSAMIPGSVVWAYLRDSGGEEQENSVDQQKGEIRTYCQAHGLVLERIFEDRARSGGSTNARESFLELIDLATSKGKHPDGILVWDYARFSRDFSDARYYIEGIRRNGVMVHSLTNPIPGGEFSWLFEDVIHFSNQEKRRQMSRDIRRAKKALVDKGFSAGGEPARGYKLEYEIISVKRNGEDRRAARWVPDFELWDVCRLAWEMRAKGASYGEIQLATKGLIYRTKNSWPTFFSNESYLGIGKAGELRIPDHHQAMVTQEVWEAVQEVKRGAPRFGELGHIHSPRRVSNPSLLSGLTRCVECGSAMVVSRERKKNYAYYICGKKVRESGLSKTCSSRKVNARKAEKAILGVVVKQILTPDFLRSLIEDVRKQAFETDNFTEEIGRIRAALTVNERSISNLVGMGEIAGIEAVRDRLYERKVEKIRLSEELRQAEAKRTASQVEISDEALALVLERWRSRFDGSGSPEEVGELRRDLAMFVNSIDLGYNFARIWYKFPSGPNTDKNRVDGLELSGSIARLPDFLGMAIPCVRPLVISWE